MAIAEYVTGLLDDAALDVTERPNLPAPPKMPNLGRLPPPYRDAERIAADPEYGRIVCFCERVPRVSSATFQSPIPRRSRRAAASHPCHERPLPRLLLRSAQGSLGCER